MAELTDNIRNFLDSNMGVAVVTATLSFIYILVIFSKTSLGKKLFNKVLTKVAEIKEDANIQKELTKQIKEQAEEEYTKLRKEYEDKLVALTNYNLELEKIIEQLGETIPNAKVKELIKSFKEAKSERLKEITDKIPTFEEIDELKALLVAKEQEVEVRVKEEVDKFKVLYDEKAKEIDNLIIEYTKKLNEIGFYEESDSDLHTDEEINDQSDEPISENDQEEDYGETEEEENSDTKETSIQGD